MCSTPFWGVVGDKKWSRFFCFGARSAIFWHLKTGTLAKVPVFKCQIRDFERPNPRTDSKTPAKHPPKWLDRHLFHAFIIFGRVFGQFWKIAFLDPFWAHFPLIKGQKMDLAGREPKNDRGVKFFGLMTSKLVLPKYFGGQRYLHSILVMLTSAVLCWAVL